MRRGMGWIVPALASAGVALLAGCGPSAHEMQIQALQEDKDRLLREKADLESQLASARLAADQATRRALELQRLWEDAKRQLAERGPASNLPPEWEGTENFAWIDVAENILFDSGKADLKPAGRTKLQQISNTIMSEFPGREVWVIGHTDTDPIRHSKWKDNLELSVFRGMTVAREMGKLGISAERLVAAGQGEHKPKVPNTSAANKQMNRRVQIAAVRVPPATGAPPPMTEEAPRAAAAVTGERG